MVQPRPMFSIVAALLLGKNEGFQNFQPTERFARSKVVELKKSEIEDPDISSGRRIFLGTVFGIAAGVLGGNEAEAKDEIFKPNPLTNTVLEQVCNFIL